MGLCDSLKITWSFRVKIHAQTQPVCYAVSPVGLTCALGAQVNTLRPVSAQR